MAKKFDVYEALKKEGFTEDVDRFGCVELTRNFEKEIELAWYGKATQRFTIVVSFNSDNTVIYADYYDDCMRLVKTKIHLNDKRAYNAIHDTAKYKGFAF